VNVIDRKFQIKAVNPVNGKTYTEADSLLLCAKDAAVPAALVAYYGECVRIGSNAEHVESVRLLLGRVKDFQSAAGGGRIPDTVGAEIPRCLNGDGVTSPVDSREIMDMAIRRQRRYYFAHNPANTMLAGIFNDLLTVNGTYEDDHDANDIRESAARKG